MEIESMEMETTEIETIEKTDGKGKAEGKMQEGKL